MDSNIIKGKKTLNGLCEPKIVCISDDEVALQKEEDICIEGQDSAVSGRGAETYVFITQEDGSSCLVPTVAIVEGLHDGTAVMNNVGSACS
ncbi:hypothetical protein J437_LFUL001970 [Ladona fulva]|uniref:Uncharacterized protein n=1 Tax=Ladona fulva TaxID=123851 RepID=A0A8K0NVI3_LADFU|nr:hypothetical protein J437_LFUL001970 [Ladona fulva]